MGSQNYFGKLKKIRRNKEKGKHSIYFFQDLNGFCIYSLRRVTLFDFNSEAVSNRITSINVVFM